MLFATAQHFSMRPALVFGAAFLGVTWVLVYLLSPRR